MSRLRSGSSVPLAAFTANTAIRARAPARSRSVTRDALRHRPHAGRAAALVDPRAARQQPLAQAEREPRRMDGRRPGHEHAARGRPASRSAPAPAPASARARTSPSTASAPTPPSCAGAVETTSSPPLRYQASTPSASHQAPTASTVSRAASTHASAAASPNSRRSAGSERSMPVTKPPLRPLGPCPQRPLSSTTTLGAGLGREHVPGRPQAGVAAADHDDVGALVALERRQHLGAARVGDPVAVRVVQHQGTWTRSAAATAARSTSRSASGTSTPTGSRAKLGATPASPSRIARLASGRCSSE